MRNFGRGDTLGERIRVTVWDEATPDQLREEEKPIYPEGVFAVVAGFLGAQPDIDVRVATLDMPEHGLTKAVLADTDVLTWRGHMVHHSVDDVVADRVQQAVLDGMGFIALHSSHYSKVFRRLMGTGASVKWREAGEKERLWVVNPGHPICDGLDEYFELPHTEMYGEFFDVPQPEELIFISWFAGGEVFRSGCCWRRGLGRIFYFKPGHETYPIYYDPNVQRVITNAVRWAKKPTQRYDRSLRRCEPIE